MEFQKFKETLSQLPTQEALVLFKLTLKPKQILELSQRAIEYSNDKVLKAKCIVLSSKLFILKECGQNYDKALDLLKKLTIALPSQEKSASVSEVTSECLLTHAQVYFDLKLYQEAMNKLCNIPSDYTFFTEVNCLKTKICIQLYLLDKASQLSNQQEESSFPNIIKLKQDLTFISDYKQIKIDEDYFQLLIDDLQQLIYLLVPDYFSKCQDYLSGLIFFNKDQIHLTVKLFFEEGEITSIKSIRQLSECLLNPLVEEALSIDDQVSYVTIISNQAQKKLGSHSKYSMQLLLHLSFLHCQRTKKEKAQSLFTQAQSLYHNSDLATEFHLLCLAYQIRSQTFGELSAPQKTVRFLQLQFKETIEETLFVPLAKLLFQQQKYEQVIEFIKIVTSAQTQILSSELLLLEMQSNLRLQNYESVLDQARQRGSLLAQSIEYHQLMAETLFFLGKHDLLEEHTQFIMKNDINKDRVIKTLQLQFHSYIQIGALAQAQRVIKTIKERCLLTKSELQVLTFTLETSEQAQKNKRLLYATLGVGAFGFLLFKFTQKMA